MNPKNLNFTLLVKHIIHESVLDFMMLNIKKQNYHKLISYINISLGGTSTVVVVEVEAEVGRTTG